MRLLALLSLSLAACAVRPEPARTIHPARQWSEDGWQFQRVPLLRVELPPLRENLRPPVPRIVPPDDFRPHFANL